MNTRDNTSAYHAIIEAISAGDLDRLDSSSPQTWRITTPRQDSHPAVLGSSTGRTRRDMPSPDLTGSVETPWPTTTKLPDE